MTRPVFFISVIPLPGITLPPGRVRFAFSSFSAGADSRDGYGWILFDWNSTALHREIRGKTGAD